MKIIFFGSGAYTIPIVKKLINLGLELVVTTEPKGELISFLKKQDIPYLYSKLGNPEDTNIIKDVNADLGILASYGAFIPQEVIDIFPLGILNIHPSLLPKYKGPSPVQYTIIAGDTETGVSIIQLDDEIDHGPIVAQEKIKLQGNETFNKLTELLFLKGSEMIVKVIQKTSKDKNIRSIPQRINSEEYTKKITKQDGEISIDNPPNPDVLDRKIRAFYPWPGVYLNVSLSKTSKKLKLLPGGLMQVEGKKPMTYKDFLNGYGEEAGIILKKLSL